MGWSISGVLLVLLLAAVGVTEVAGQAQADLSGSWQLNGELSDDPRERMAEAGSGRAGSGSAGQGGFGGTGGGRAGGRSGRGGSGGGRGQFSEEDRERLRRFRETALTMAEKFTIAQSDSTVAFTFQGTSTLTLHTDGRKLKQESDDLGKIEIKAKWNDGELVVERKMDGGKITERYSHAQYSERLFVTTKVEFSRMPRAIVFRRVYDPVVQQ